MKARPFGLFLVLSALAATASAAVNITIRQVGADVVGTVSGSLDITSGVGTPGFQATPTSGLLARSNSGYYYAAGAGAHEQFSVTWITEQQLFPTNAVRAASASSGDFVGVSYASLAAHIQLPSGYSSGASLSGTSTWAGQSINSLGLTPGTYVFDYGPDRVTFNVVDPTPQPVPSMSVVGLILTALGLGVVGMRRMRTVPAKPN